MYKYSITGMNVRLGVLTCKKHILFEEETQ